ncbi:MAG: NAD(+) synthase [Firmicutes bacterium]|nr:NAD(+) synthase [Bacillota bacterium]
MRAYESEVQARVGFLRRALEESGAKGFVFGNSGGKDSALVGVLCKMACADTVGVMLPCQAARGYGEDMRDALSVAAQFEIRTRTIDLADTRAALLLALEKNAVLTDAARGNIAPRLRMTALYAIAAAENRLVAGTGNRDEVYMGYFTKWGDGAYDVNPIADLLVFEVYACLRHLGVPPSILSKAPSAGLFEGQTDEEEMGVTYAAIDQFLLSGEASERDRAIIDSYHRRSEHKRRPPLIFTSNKL